MIGVFCSDYFLYAPCQNQKHPPSRFAPGGQTSFDFLLSKE